MVECTNTGTDRGAEGYAKDMAKHGRAHLAPTGHWHGHGKV